MDIKEAISCLEFVTYEYQKFKSGNPGSRSWTEKPSGEIKLERLPEQEYNDNKEGGEVCERHVVSSR